MATIDDVPVLAGAWQVYTFQGAHDVVAGWVNQLLEETRERQGPDRDGVPAVRLQVEPNDADGGVVATLMVYLLPDLDAFDDAFGESRPALCGSEVRRAGLRAGACARAPGHDGRCRTAVEIESEADDLSGAGEP